MSYGGWEHRIAVYQSANAPSNANEVIRDLVYSIGADSNYTSRGGAIYGNPWIHDFSGGTYGNYATAVKNKIIAAGYSWVICITLDDVLFWNPVGTVTMEYKGQSGLGQACGQTLMNTYICTYSNKFYSVVKGIYATFTAVPDPSMLFDHWADQNGNIYSDNPLSKYLDSGLILQAYFTPPYGEMITAGAHIVRNPSLSEHVTPGVHVVRLAFSEHTTAGAKINRIVPVEHVTIGAQILRNIGTEHVTVAAKIVRVQGPPPPAPCTEPKGSLNPIDWLSYWGCLIQAGLTNISNILSGVSGKIQVDLSGLLPDWLKDSLTSLSTAIITFGDFILDPAAFITTIVKTLIKEESPSLVDDFTKAYSTVGMHLVDYNMTDKLSLLQSAIYQQYKGTTQKYLEGILELLGNAELSPEELQARVTDVAMTAASDVQAWAAVYEAIPWIDLSVFSDAAKTSLNFLGIESISRDYIDSLIQAGLSRGWNYAANKQFPTALPPIDQLMTLRRTGAIALSDYTLKGTQASGIDSKTLESLYQNSLSLPTLDDIITWNARHSDSPISIPQSLEVLGIRSGSIPNISVDLANLIEERKFNDIPLRTARSVYSSGVMSEADLDSVLTRHMLRKDLLPGQTMSDFDMMKAYCQAGKTAADAKKEPKATKEKLFTPPQLVSLVADGILTQSEADGEIDLYSYDLAHKAVLKRWIAAKAAAKKPDSPRAASTQ